MDWKRHKTIFYLSEDKSDVKIASFDFDHTLVRPKNSRVHPKDKDDIELVFPNIKEVLLKLVINGYEIVIFSNQSSFDKLDKREIITSRIEKFKEMMEIPISIYISTQPDYNRKPNTGMWDEFYGKRNIDFKNSFYVGDAAGRNKNPITDKKDFACSDRMFAANIGLTFYTPEKYFDPGNYTKLYPFVMSKTWLTFPTEQPALDVEDYDVIILIGPPGSGKSSLAESLEDFTLVSQDVLKYKTKCIKLMDSTLKSGGKVIVDATNPKREKRKMYLDIAKNYGKKVLGIYININKEQSMFLVNYRCKLEKRNRLPDVAIHAFFKNFEKPIKGEGFDKIIERSFVPDKNLELFRQYF